MNEELKKYIRSVISENFNSMDDNIGEESTIEQEIKHIVQDVAEHKTTVDDAVFSILHIAEFISNYAHRATMEPSMNENAVTGASPRAAFRNRIIDIVNEYLNMHVGVKNIKQELNNIVNSIDDIAIKKVADVGGFMSEEAQELEEERITNDEGKEFAKRKENFIGSHCWGEKLGDGSYVVMSYGKQFPLYIFWNKKNKWYENSDHYLYDGEPQESTEEHRADLRPTDETRKKQADWMRKLSKHLLKVNGMADYEHISVEPGTKN